MSKHTEEGNMDLTNIDPVILCHDINPNDNELALISMDWVKKVSKMLNTTEFRTIKGDFRRILTDVENMDDYLNTLREELNFHTTNKDIQIFMEMEKNTTDSINNVLGRVDLSDRNVSSHETNENLEH